MAKYRKKPVVIEAVQFTEADCWTCWLEHKLFMGKWSVGGNYNSEQRKIYDGFVIIDTLEGQMRGEIGDWIIKGVNGEFYPCKPDIFAKTYDLAE
jgi:hypothetical protein